MQICLSANSRNIFNGDSYTVNTHTEATAYRFTIRFGFISSMKSGLFECFALSGLQRFFADLSSVRLCILSPKRNCLSSKKGHRSISVTYVGTEELAHLEMVGTIVYQLTRNLTQEEIQKQGFDAYFIDHTTGVYPAAASGAPFSAACIAVTGDTLADINEDLAAEQKARVTYDNILRFADDPDVRDPIKSCASARLCITSALARACASRLTDSIPKTSTRLTPRSTKQKRAALFRCLPVFPMAYGEFVTS